MAESGCENLLLCQSVIDEVAPKLAFADDRGRVLERKRLSRRAFARVLEQRPPLRVLMEAWVLPR